MRVYISSILTSEFLQEHYVQQDKTSEQIGQEIGHSGSAVRHHLRRLGFKMRIGPQKGRSFYNKGQLKPGSIPWNKGKKIEEPPWNKGLTKETHPSIADMAQKRIGIKFPNNSGPAHPNWKNGATEEGRRIRASPEYALWRTSVFERDNYTCQGCGVHGGKLEAHHRERFASHPELRLTVSNGITFCYHCHETEHLDVPWLKGRPKTAEHKRKLSEIKKGKPSWNKGIPMSPEAKAKMVAKKKGQPAWNKGLRKDTTPQLANAGAANRIRLLGKKGKDSPVWKRWHPEEFVEKH